MHERMYGKFSSSITAFLAKQVKLFGLLVYLLSIFLRLKIASNRHAQENNCHVNLRSQTQHFPPSPLRDP
jgi:hypothetical protein